MLRLSLLILLILIAVLLVHLLYKKYLASILKVGLYSGGDDSDEIKEMFEVWKRESIIPRELYENQPPTLETVQKALAYYNHGGYYPITDEPYIPPEGKDPLPYMRTAYIDGVKRDYLQIPGCISRDPSFHRKYAKRGNDLMLKHFKDGEPLYLSFVGNGGGKEAPMFAAMSPIFNDARDDLWYVEKNGELTPQKSKLASGLYYSESTGKPIKCSKKVLKPSSIDVLIGGNGSAGEIITIAMKTLQRDSAPITIRGRRTAGGTTMIGWCKLSHGGDAEYPVGHMTDAWSTDYSRGISPDVEIDNPFAHEN